MTTQPNPEPPITLTTLPAHRALIYRSRVHSNDWRTPITLQKRLLAEFLQTHSLNSQIPTIPYLSFIPRSTPQYVETGYILTPTTSDLIYSSLKSETGEEVKEVGWDEEVGEGWFVRVVEEGECLKLVHEGSYERYYEAWGRVWREVEERGLKMAGVPEQRVLMDYTEVEERDLRSELIVPIVRK
ncbi:hypothetical protein HK097_008020 [Rhizophlyctis rosea]|uniref:AraC effector-binding domain-containing protein n=1 Tax=Rhizophlyctis rosea TaxID=64517 RepID=A0AAD5SD44_9FUNG|nr:hypothetical protein HK097_008020 [Rhizophlyctis rosea]